MLRKDNHLLLKLTLSNMPVLFVSALIKANEVETHLKEFLLKRGMGDTVYRPKKL